MSKQKTGRKNGYETKVAPRLEEVKKWAEEGATDKEIAESLGVGYSTFLKYKSEIQEFQDLLKKAHQVPVKEIKKALYKRATGFQYVEVKTTKGVDTDGNSYFKTEETLKTALADVAAAMVLLKHWDKDEEWTNDPASLRLKKEELELKKQQAEKEDW